MAKKIQRMVERIYPHDVLQCVLVQQFPLLGRLLQSEHKPGAGHPVGVELVTRHRLEQLLLINSHKSCMQIYFICSII